MIKKIIIFIVVLTLLFYCAACKVSAPSIDPSISQQTTTTSPSTTPPQPTTEANFDTELINFLEENYEFSTKNYVFSPLSYKYALLLATYGANGTTQEELYKAMGYESLEELLEWGKSVNTYVEEFEANAQKTLDDNKKPTRKLTIANSVWHNKDEKGIVKEAYSSYLKENFNSETHNVEKDILASSINDWVNQKTNGLIPSIVEESLEANTVLVNSLYLKSPWLNEQHKLETPLTFNGINGAKDISFLVSEARYRSYKDDDCTLVIVPLHGGLQCVYVMGNTENLSAKINNAQYTPIKLYAPEFTIKTSLDNSELVDFLKRKNVTMAFDREHSDFSNLIDDAQIHISDIVQKAKIITNEDGIEASAATAIIMDANDAVEPEYESLFFNEPFKFFIYDNQTEHLLFCGNYCDPQ